LPSELGNLSKTKKMEGGGGGLWHQWDENDSQWKHIFQATYSTDRTLFFNSTYIQIGDGKNTTFWEARWLFDAAPKDLAPGLFKAARFKKRSVHSELQNSNWIRNIKDPLNGELLEEFVQLYIALSAINLSNTKDTINWKWTPNGQFSVVSAYECQFREAMTFYPASEVWKANVEPKCNFFAWLILHNKAPTADNLAKIKLAL
jgi:hypothetical protein